ncbi:MAG: hypothetical protein ABI777_04055 [Betaproteobacteria bacterium]
MHVLRFAAACGVAIALAACTASNPMVVRNAGVPTYAPTQFVDVLEAPPTRPFLEIATINVPGEPGAARTQVLAQIRTQAALLGADAVILQDVSRQAPVVPQLNPTTGKNENTGGQAIPAFRGIAIKYK